MAENERKRLQLWEKRLTSSSKMFDEWSQFYETDRLEKYYLGKQWKGQTEEVAKKLYTINLVYASMETQKPSLIFGAPQIKVEPRPERSADLGSNAQQRADLCRDSIQTFIDDPDVLFIEETALALHEAHFRFGVVEVGYTSDYMDNPDAGKPFLKEGKEVKDSNGETVLQPDRTLTSEQIYIKRIPSKNFRVSMSSKNALSRNDWVGYFEWVYLEDVKRNGNYKHTESLKATGQISESLREKESDPEELERRHGMVKLWRVWDIRKKVRHTFVPGHKYFLQDSVPFKFLPFAIIKFHEILDSFYPFPPVYSWIGPQDEINETRESQRAHRRRFYRRYTYTEGSIDDTELEKLENGGDGVYAKANTANPLIPVPDAPLSADNWTHLDQSKQDFMVVSSVGGEQRGVAESSTATQASIIDVRARMRESAARARVALWLSNIARLMLLTIRDNMILPFWIKRNTDPFADPIEKEKIALLWQQITSEELENIDLDISVDLASMSPVTQEAQRNDWNQVLLLLTNPTLCQILAMSEVLLRKTLLLYGIKSESEVQEIKKVIQVVATQAQLAAMAGAAKPSAGSPSPKSAGAPNSNGGGAPLSGQDLSSMLGALSQGGAVN